MHIFTHHHHHHHHHWLMTIDKDLGQIEEGGLFIASTQLSAIVVLAIIAMIVIIINITIIVFIILWQFHYCKKGKVDQNLRITPLCH